MAIFSFSVHHLSHGLDAVARAHTRAGDLAHDLLETIDKTHGCVVIPTCNRLDLLVEANEEAGTGLERFLARRLAVADIVMRRDHDAIEHVVRVAAGLDSLVVGEREVSGQVRRALTVAHRDSTSSVALTRLLQGALRTSRIIAQLTGLASQGRSVVAAALDIVASERALAGCRALIVGTGAYAGAAVAALRSRGVLDIACYSSSGRAQHFASGHDLEAVSQGGLVDAMAEADLVITCRGLGSPVVMRSDVEAACDQRSGELLILDLALNRDLEDDARRVPGVRVITMEEVRRQVPDVAQRQVERAEELVAEGVGAIESDLRERAATPVVRAVRAYVDAALETEMARLPSEGTIEASQARQALRRLAAKMAHTPTVRAREAACQGATTAFARAVEQVIGVTVAPSSVNRVDPSEGDWDALACPVTGLTTDDLARNNEKEKQ